jgi:hypothetical protein
MKADMTYLSTYLPAGNERDRVSQYSLSPGQHLTARTTKYESGGANNSAANFGRQN